MVSSVAVAWLVGGFSPRMLFLLEVNYGHHPICWMETFKTVKEKLYSIIENSWRCVEILFRPFTFSPISPCKMGMGTPTGASRGSQIRLFLVFNQPFLWGGKSF
jgi:hypothetical protein